VHPIVFAKRRTSLFNHDTSFAGYSKPTPGPDILKVELERMRIREGLIDGNIADSVGKKEESLRSFAASPDI
jgi:hypothetical protein